MDSGGECQNVSAREGSLVSRGSSNVRAVAPSVCLRCANVDVGSTETVVAPVLERTRSFMAGRLGDGGRLMAGGKCGGVTRKEHVILGPRYR